LFFFHRPRFFQSLAIACFIGYHLLLLEIHIFALFVPEAGISPYYFYFLRYQSQFRQKEFFICFGIHGLQNSENG
jgi:hypothetical protein